MGLAMPQNSTGQVATLNIQRHDGHSYSNEQHRQNNVLNAHNDQHRQSYFYGNMIGMTLWWSCQVEKFSNERLYWMIDKLSLGPWTISRLEVISRPRSS